MGQEEVLKFLEKDKERWYDYEEIMLALNVTEQAICKVLKTLEDSGDVYIKEIAGKQKNKVRKLYKFKPLDQDFADVLHEIKQKRTEQTFVNQSDIIALLTLKELRQINKSLSKIRE